MNQRISLIEEFVQMNTNFRLVADEIRKFDWDYDGELFWVSGVSISSILKRLQGGEIEKKDVEYWADFLESREDIDMDKVAREVIFKLANPELGYRLDSVLVDQMIKDLSILKLP